MGIKFGMAIDPLYSRKACHISDGGVEFVPKSTQVMDLVAITNTCLVLAILPQHDTPRNTDVWLIKLALHCRHPHQWKKTWTRRVSSSFSKNEEAGRHPILGRGR